MCVVVFLHRTATARGKAEQADIAALHAREDAQSAGLCSKQYQSDFCKGDNSQDIIEGKISLSCLVFLMYAIWFSKKIPSWARASHTRLLQNVVFQS